jgi:hypothetical protein
MAFRRRTLLCLRKSSGTEMFGSNNDLRARRIVVMFFAVLSGVSAAAVAVLPAVHA